MSASKNVQNAIDKKKMSKTQKSIFLINSVAQCRISHYILTPPTTSHFHIQTTITIKNILVNKIFIYSFRFISIVATNFMFHYVSVTNFMSLISHNFHYWHYIGQAWFEGELLWLKNSEPYYNNHLSLDVSI